MENLFENILLKDEIIKETYRPNKKRFYNTRILISYVLCSFLSLCALILGIVYYIKKDSAKYLVVLIGGAVILMVFSVLYHLYLKKIYPNVVYCLTNKRLIVRNGFKGLCYKSIFLNDIDNVSVEVGLLDDFLSKDCGSIKFGTKSLPINDELNNNIFTFKFIDKPFDFYKEINNILNR